MTYRGGAEAWYEVRARGRTWRFAGCEDIHTVMSVVYNVPWFTGATVSVTNYVDP